jgi:hypothetical protein
MRGFSEAVRVLEDDLHVARQPRAAGACIRRVTSAARESADARRGGLDQPQQQRAGGGLAAAAIRRPWPRSRPGDLRRSRHRRRAPAAPKTLAKAAAGDRSACDAGPRPFRNAVLAGLGRPVMPGSRHPSWGCSDAGSASRNAGGDLVAVAGIGCASGGVLVAQAGSVWRMGSAGRSGSPGRPATDWCPSLGTVPQSMVSRALPCGGVDARGCEAHQPLRVGVRRPREDLAHRPVSTTRPAYITATRAHTSATTPRSCVISSTAMPAFGCCSSAHAASRICAWMVTSSAVVGSSAISRRGSAGQGHGDHHALAHAAAESSCG